MKQRLLCLIVIYIPLFLFSQSDLSNKGINWTEGLTWQQVLHRGAHGTLRTRDSVALDQRCDDALRLGDAAGIL